MPYIALVRGTRGQVETGLQRLGIWEADYHSGDNMYVRFLIPYKYERELRRWLARPCPFPVPPLTLMYYTYHKGESDDEEDRESTSTRD